MRTERPDTTRPLRLPLQTGAGALRDLLAASLLGTALLVGTAALMGAMLAAVLQLEISWTIGLWIASAALGAQAVRTLAGGISSARTHRASDVFVTARGMRIVGGRRHGLDATWDRVDGARSSVEPAITGRGMLFLGGARYRRALFVHVDGEPVAIAESADEAEDEALEGAFGAIQRACGVVETRRSRGSSERPAHGLACGACGAPCAIDDRPSTTCAFCGQEVIVPEDVRVKLREAREHARLASAVSHAVERLLDQPGADRTNLAILSAGLGAGAALVVSVGVTIALVALHASTTTCTAILVASLTGAAGLVLLAYAHVADRRGLGTLTLGFTAKTTESGASCRRCSAPLPAADDGHASLVVRCIYCNADSVCAPGVDHTNASLRAAHVELADVLRDTGRTTWLLRAAAIGSLAFSVALVVSAALR